MEGFAITDIEPEYKTENEWMEQEDSWWAEYYRMNGSSLPDVIDEETYEHLEE